MNPNLRKSEIATQIHYRLVESLRASEERYRDLVERLQSVVFHVDCDGRTRFLNQAWTDLLGFEASACLGQPLSDFVHSMDREAFCQALKQVEATHEIRFVANDGGVVWVVLSMGARCEDGGLVGSLRDITSEREAEHMRADFLASVSHELRTPLTSILGFAQALERHPDTQADERQRYLGIITDQARRLKGLVNGLIDLTRIDAGEFGCCLKPISVLDYLERYSAVFQPLALAEGVELVTDFEIDPDVVIQVSLDTGRFAVALDNLLGNAVKFSNGADNVRLEAHTSNEQLVIRVIDRGLGIPPEHLPHVFERFFRVPRPGLEIPGTGFGLAIAREIVTGHGGTISVTSENQIGSTFEIKLPLTTPAQQPVQEWV